MYSCNVDGRYWFWHGFNPNAVSATAISGLAAILSVLMPKLLPNNADGQQQLHWLSDFSWYTVF